MSQLSNKLDNLIQDAKRAVQRVQIKQYQSNQMHPAVNEQLISTSAMGSEQSLSSHPRDECTISQTWHQSAEENSHGNVEQLDALHQLAAMRQQYELKQQEVEVLQAQIQRLCSFVEAAVEKEAPGDSHICHEAQLKQKTEELQSQLDQVTSELQQCKTQLHAALESAQQLQSILATTSAAKAGLERHAGALKLLLAEQIRENACLATGLSQCQDGLDIACSQLHEAERRQTITQAEITSKEEDLQALHTALHKMSEQVAELAGQDLQRLPSSQQLTAQHQRLIGSRRTTADCQEQPACRDTPPPQLQLQQQVQQQQELIAKQQQDLSRQQQELVATAQRLQDVCSMLALKDDSVAHFKRHTSMLEQQLEATKQQMEASRKPTMHSTTSDNIAKCSSTSSAAQATSLSTALTGASITPAPQPTIADGEVNDSPETPRAGVAGAPSLQLNMSMPPSLVQPDTSASASQCLGEQIAALSPFAKARGFLAQRDTDAVARLKEELHDSQQQLKELKAELAAAANQLHGLQTAYTVKTAQCNRLDSESRQSDRQLKQVQAAAASEQEAVRQQLAALSDRVVELEAELVAAQQREQQTQQELASVRTKLAQVLDAVVQEADSLQKHKPQLQALYAQDMPAMMAALGISSSCMDATQPAAMHGSTTTTTLTVLGPEPALDEVPSSACRRVDGSSCLLGDPVAAGTPSKEGGLFGGNKLFGALLGRRKSSGPAEIGQIGERIMLRSTSTASGEWPRAVTPLAGAPSHNFSRVGSRTASLEGPCFQNILGVVNGCSRQLGSCTSSRAPTPPQVQGSCAGQVASMCDNAAAQLASLQEADELQGSGSLSSASVTTPIGKVNSGLCTAGRAAFLVSCQSGVPCTADDHDINRQSPLRARMSLPGPVAEKLDALKGLLHKLTPDKDRAQ